MHKIDKNIPAPEFKRGDRFKYPFHKMEVGDSVFFQTTSQQPYRSAHMYGRRNSQRYVTKLEGNGRRIWRVE